MCRRHGPANPPDDNPGYVSQVTSSAGLVGSLPLRRRWLPHGKPGLYAPCGPTGGHTIQPLTRAAIAQVRRPTEVRAHTTDLPTSPKSPLGPALDIDSSGEWSSYVISTKVDGIYVVTPPDTKPRDSTTSHYALRRGPFRSL